MEQKLHEAKLKEKLEALNAIGTVIAHEMRTSLATISISIDRMKLNEDQCPSKNYQDNIKLFKACKDTIKSTIFFIDMMLVKFRNMHAAKNLKNSFTTCSIVADITEALNQYPFFDQEKDLITWHDHKLSFKYIGDSLLTRHILFNLLRNALKAIKTAEKGNITIKLQHDKAFNSVIFTDTAGGVSAKRVPKIFDTFVTTGDMKNKGGLGLAFCKMVMKSYGGDIACMAKQGKYTKFILKFPTIK